MVVSQLRFTPSSVPLRVTVNPVVVLTALDFYQRRTAGQTKVIGALLGKRVEQTIDLTNAFPVPFLETEDSDVRTKYISFILVGR